LTIIGLSSSGLNVISGGVSTPLQLAGCPAEYADATTGFCESHVLQDPRVWLGILVGGVMTAFLLLYRVKGESNSVAATLLLTAQVPSSGLCFSSPSSLGRVRPRSLLSPTPPLETPTLSFSKTSSLREASSCSVRRTLIGVPTATEKSGLLL
jgi:hypothetical protein